MIIKDREIPRIILKPQALLRRFPLHHHKIQILVDELNRRTAGHKGEEALDYPLLIKPLITNEEARKFLNIESRYVTARHQKIHHLRPHPTLQTKRPRKLKQKTRHHQVTGPSSLLNPFLRPFLDIFHQRFQRISFFSEGVFNSYRGFGVDFPFDDAFFFEFFQALGEHSAADAGCIFYGAVALRTGKQLVDDKGVPPRADDADGFFESWTNFSSVHHISPPFVRRIISYVMINYKLVT
jgi:hypothetical protein